MADFFEQAQAIWKALDSMSEQDPEAYKKFISEQLQSGKDSFIKETKKGSGSKGKGSRVDDDLAKAFGNLSMLSSGLPKGSKVIGGKSGIEKEKPKVKGDSDKNKPFVKASQNKDAKKKKPEDEGVHLLDDEICQGSLLDGIVKKSTSMKEESELDEMPTISKLIIPSAESAPVGSQKKKGPLIEEI